MLVKDEAKQRASSVLENYWSGRFPVDPAQIAVELGIQIEKDFLPEDTSGMIIKKPDSDARIYVQISDAPVRQRFTIAHEIGHFVERMFVRDAPDNEFSFVERRGGKSTMHEFFANEFAANLLMPESEVRALSELGADKLRMAAHFGVSASALVWRLHKLEL